MSSLNIRLDAAFDARHVIRAVNERRHFAREHALRFALLRRRGVRVRQIVDRFARQKREEAQIRVDVAIVGVQPELIEAQTATSAARSSQIAPASVLPNFAPVAVVMQRQDQAVRLARRAACE